jgi:diaminohydroxyphosphoribosylaminopyrimidine deaminase/5-amino-6-(5-phosphoribosylamino)uracil reductase
MTAPRSSGTSHDRTERAMMRRALALARRGWGQTAPNPMVGAVVVRDGAVVGAGFHARFGEAHAEAAALAAAGDAARESTVYVTLEPCNHHGKTPPCTEALIAAGVKRVVAATRDPNPEAKGGAERLRAAGIEVDFGVEADAASELNAPFIFAATGSTRPWVTIKLALSLDGAIADAGRGQRWLTGDKARREVHRLRAGHDAVAVGIGTALADNPQLTVRQGKRPRTAPLRVVFDREARLPVKSKLVESARRTPTLLIVGHPDQVRAAALTAKGVQVESVAGLGPALQLLRAKGVQSLLVEGGAGLAGAFLEAGLADRLIIFQAPVLLGAGALPAFGTAPDLGRLRLVERKEFDDDLMSMYALR